MKTHLLRCASMCPMGGLLPQSFLPRALICNCLLIETSSGLVLVDTGIGIRDMADPKRLGLMHFFLGLDLKVESTAARQVERLGFSISDVRHIIPTHLDLDHAGGLSDFPTAEVHILELEKAAALAPRTFRQRERYRSSHWSHSPQWQTYDADAGETWNGFHRVRELRGLPPEILLVSLPGHTPGHAGVVVSTGLEDSGWLLHAGDAYYDRRAMDKNAVTTPGMRIFERLAHEQFSRALETRERLRRLRLDHSQIRSICAHDAGERLC
ncbi:MAG: MBL fold metallo-hydrolase [Elusimicrobia bacterium]|nr:MBL fold metallo-hydrolase [Elusimicrobiota bacterium]